MSEIFEKLKSIATSVMVTLLFVVLVGSPFGFLLIGVAYGIDGLFFVGVAYVLMLILFGIRIMKE